ncbi:unnamed protein product [Gordionus sp. m RMFG-2023]|uniref:inhibitor of growth protein 5-like n=1 Tax=Gordionus sp. m RMFG-2023 TaxID=3053472 RepID=UPI0030DEDC59
MYGINLEQYLETLEGLPLEMKKKFTQMRELDRKVIDNLRYIEDVSQSYISQFSGLHANEKTEKQKAIAKKYKRCKEMSDSKIQLAIQTYEMVDKHIRRLDAELAKFEAKLKHKAAIINLSNQNNLAINTNDNHDGNKVNTSVKRKLFQNNITQNDSIVQKSNSKVLTKSADSIKKKKMKENKFIIKRRLEIEDDETPRMNLKATKNKRSNNIISSPFEPSSSNYNSTPNTSLDKLNQFSSLHKSSPAVNDSPTNLLPSTSSFPSFSHPSQILDMPVDPNEPTYCVCHQVSYGEMIGCDNLDCLVEWFHFGCVGLTHKPKGKWYCPTCSLMFNKSHKKKTSS